MTNGRPITIARAFLMLCFLVAVAACTRGTSVDRPDPQTLVCGETTYQEVVARYGTPWAKGESVSNGHSIVATAYAYASLVDEAHAPGVEPARGLNLWFESDVLIGYEFRSSFESDHTDFDESRMTEIEEGETNRQGVIGVFGQPNGEYIYPMMQEESHTGLVYSYMHVDAGLLGAKQFEKRLIIAVDETDIVRDIQFSKGSAE